MFLWRDAHMCLLNQRFLLTEAGEGGWIERWWQESSAGPLFNVYHFHPPLTITWMKKRSRGESSGFSSTHWLNWWSSGTERACGDGWSISSAKRTSYRGEGLVLSFFCLNVFTFLSVNIKDFYRAFKQAAAEHPFPHPPSLPPPPTIYPFSPSFILTVCSGSKLTLAMPDDSRHIRGMSWLI